jgi:hypothetical protein
LGIFFVLLSERHNIIHWDDGWETEVFSNCLSKESLSAALAPDLSPSCQQDNPEFPPQGQGKADEEEEEIQEAEHHQEESEYLPGGVGEALGSSEPEDESIASNVSNDDNDQVEEERGEEGGNADGSFQEIIIIIMMILMVWCLGSWAQRHLNWIIMAKNAAIAHIKTLIGKSFSMKHKNKSMPLPFVDKWIPSDPSMGQRIYTRASFSISSFILCLLIGMSPLEKFTQK